jgi:hypothetical protein
MGKIRRRITKALQLRSHQRTNPGGQLLHGMAFGMDENGQRKGIRTFVEQTNKNARKRVMKINLMRKLQNGSILKKIWKIGNIHQAQADKYYVKTRRQKCMDLVACLWLKNFT